MRPPPPKHRHPPARRVRRSAPQPYRMRVPQVLWLVPIVIVIGFGVVLGFFVAQEMRTSAIQADALSRLAQEIHFEMGEGPNTRLFTPSDGPYNQRLGYSYLPFFTKALAANDYAIAEQMRASPRFQDLVRRSFYPIYEAKTVAGLRLTDRNGQSLYEASYPSHVFARFESIPPLLIATLLHIENRELLKEGPATRNPVIEWDRFLYAGLGQALQSVMPGLKAGGGSTLATQIEKFRYAPGGQTQDALDKLRQIASASIRAYRHGPDTREERKRIVLDYLNSTPLSARAGFGEINSIGDGLWAWFGRDLDETAALLRLPETDPDSLRAKAVAYREVLGLILAQRRPTYYLLTDRNALDNLTDQTLEHLEQAGVISAALRQATRAAAFRFLPDPPAPPAAPFLEQKATNALRNHLLAMLGLKNLYELDRVDLTASGTLDQNAQKQVTAFLKNMGSPAFLESIGLYGFRLLKPENDPAKIKWSVVLYERGAEGNRLRVQADNIDAPLDMNEGAKLDLGSTAKLRTLVTYLEIIGELHRRYAGLSVEDLRGLAEEAPDALTSWATTWLATRPQATLPEMLDGALERKYSAHPGEAFFTGGGLHTFENFEKREDSRIMDLHEAMRDSVNLVFVRLMRDIVNYTIAQGQLTRHELLGDPDQPARRSYLERYADREGSVFLNRYINDYHGLGPDEALERLSRRARKGVTAQAILFRSLRPQASLGVFAAWLQRHSLVPLDVARLQKLYQDYPPTRYTLADRGYIAGLNPLELWLVGYKQANPKASREEVLAVSRPIRIESYAWLFHPRLKGAQDTRIRILLEADAFARIHQRWARLGYPFERLVPSYATAIGSSADRPGALAELVGILLNDGLRKPMLRFDSLHFAAQTPYETRFVAAGRKAEQVLDPAVTRAVRGVMREVVENGTAKRLRGAYLDAQGQPLAVGAKTGTGDHRREEYGAGGRLLASHVVNRTGTIAFYLGDRFFGTITAHVAGEEAANYKFTSALSAQMLKALAPILQPLINGTPATGAGPSVGAPAPAVAPAITPKPAPEEAGDAGEESITGEDPAAYRPTTPEP